MSLWCLFFDPHLTTLSHQWSIGVQLKKWPNNTHISYTCRKWSYCQLNPCGCATQDSWNRSQFCKFSTILTQTMMFMTCSRWQYPKWSVLKSLKCPTSVHPQSEMYRFGLYVSQSRGGHFIVKLNTTCETIMLPLYYMSYIILKFMIFFYIYITKNNIFLHFL